MSEDKNPTATFSDDLIGFAPVELPSRGAYYKDGDGILDVVHVRPILTKDEKVLASTPENKIPETILNLCVKEDFDPKKLLIGDFEYLFIKIRIMSYGSDVPISLVCSNCKTVYNAELDLRELPCSYHSDKDHPEPIPATLPITNKEVSYRLPRYGDVVKALNKSNTLKQQNIKVSFGKTSAKEESAVIPDTTSVDLLNYTILTVDKMGSTEKERFVKEEMPQGDAIYIRKQIEKNMPAPQSDVTHLCTCGTVITKKVSSNEFFRLDF